MHLFRTKQTVIFLWNARFSVKLVLISAFKCLVFLACLTYLPFLCFLNHLHPKFSYQIALLIVLNMMLLNFRYKEDGHCKGVPEFTPPAPIRLRWEIPKPCIDQIEKSYQVIKLFKIITSIYFVNCIFLRWPLHCSMMLTSVCLPILLTARVWWKNAASAQMRIFKWHFNWHTIA